MGESIGIGLVSYGSREVAIADALLCSERYTVKLYIVDKTRNQYNVTHASEHVTIPSMDPQRICKFFRKYSDAIDFIIVGPEEPIIKGIRDIVEAETDISVISPTKEYALEGSKVAQRYLIEKVVPEANPRFKVFRPSSKTNPDELKSELWDWLDDLRNQAVVKPDGASRGKGVGVWGDHFTTREDLFHHFMNNYQFGSVIVEEKLRGEESSFMAFCDGNHLAPLPETRDYKRAFDGDRGPNTGGMGSYKDTKNWLPFLTKSDYEKEIDIVTKVFEHLRGKTRNTGLLGIPFYVAFMHTSKGPKVLEINSRPGDPEIQNILPVLKGDLVEICQAIIEGNLGRVDVEPKATVVTYKVPPTYGGKEPDYRGSTKVDLSKTEKLVTSYGGKLRLYPAALELSDNECHALSSRTVCTVGIGENIEEARKISLEGLHNIQGGGLWNRLDIASEKHIQKSIENMRSLRSKT